MLVRLELALPPVLPPLRRRREDLGLLSAYFLREAGAQAASISAAAGRRLYCGRFPGNIRQLRTALRSALQLSEGRIEIDHLPPPERPEAAQSAAGPAAPEAGSGVTSGATAAAAAPTAEVVDAALRTSRGNVVQAAARLGTHPRQLYRWIGRLGLDLSSYRR